MCKEKSKHFLSLWVSSCIPALALLWRSISSLFITLIQKTHSTRGIGFGRCRFACSMLNHTLLQLWCLLLPTSRDDRRTKSRLLEDSAVEAFLVRHLICPLNYQQPVLAPPATYRKHVWEMWLAAWPFFPFQHLRNNIPRCIFLSTCFWQGQQRPPPANVMLWLTITSRACLSLSVFWFIKTNLSVSLAKVHWISVSTLHTAKDLYFLIYQNASPASSSPLSKQSHAH